MQTVYDYVSMAFFTGLIVLFLHRSSQPNVPDDDPMWRYVVAMAGCAVGDVAGNRGYSVIAWPFFVLTAIFVFRVLLPLKGSPPPP